MDIQLLEGLGQAPIPGPTPAGSDARDDPRFDALQIEIAKLTTPGAGVIDWSRVAQLGGQLLAERGKDLLVGSYVAAAAMHLADLPGLQVGLSILNGLVTQYWEGMSPPVSRLRARRNAIQWLIDRIDLITQDARWEQLSPVPQARMQALLTHIQQLDDALRTHDEDAPSLRPIRQWLERLPVEEPAPAPPTATAAPTAPATPQPEARSAPLSAPNPSALATSSSPPPRPQNAVVPPPALSAPDDNLEHALEQAFAHLNTLADLMMEADLSDPRAYRTSRFANWTNLTLLPPANEGRTHIPAPLSQVVDVWGRMSSAGSEPTDALRFAEAQLPAFPFWLDLQWMAAQALGQLQHASAQQAVEAATRAFLARLPGVETLSFANGMPFANGDTRQWLAGLSAQAEDASALPARTDTALTQRPQNVDKVFAQARSLAANGELEAAVSVLQKALNDSREAAPSLLLRTRLCALLSEHLPGRVPAAFADELLTQVQRHDLSHWDPNLALEALAAAFLILREDENRSADAAQTLRAIANLDASRALALMH